MTAAAITPGISSAALPSDPAGVPFLTFAQATVAGDYALACDQLATATLLRNTLPPPPNRPVAVRACAAALADEAASLDDEERGQTASTTVVKVRVWPGRARVTVETDFRGLKPRATGTAVIEQSSWKIAKVPSGEHVGSSLLREVPSESMAPTLQVGDWVLVDRAAYRRSKPRVGDIVVFYPPAGAGAAKQCAQRPPRGQACALATRRTLTSTFIKRIVARGGDRVSLRRGRLIRNGRQAHEPYVIPCIPSDRGCTFPRPFRLAKGQYYVLGDNRGESDDSRFWGPITTASIVGRVRRVGF